MNQTRCIVILSILALFVASVSVAGNISLPDASQKVFEGKPCINSPRAIQSKPAPASQHHRAARVIYPFLFAPSCQGGDCVGNHQRI